MAVRDAASRTGRHLHADRHRQRPARGRPSFSPHTRAEEWPTPRIPAVPAAHAGTRGAWAQSGTWAPSGSNGRRWGRVRQHGARRSRCRRRTDHGGGHHRGLVELDEQVATAGPDAARLALCIPHLTVSARTSQHPRQSRCPPRPPRLKPIVLSPNGTMKNASEIPVHPTDPGSGTAVLDPRHAILLKALRVCERGEP